MEVRLADSNDLIGVMTVLDAAMLDATAQTVSRRIDADNVLVAVSQRRVLGALVAVPRRDGAHVEQVAVRRRRRDSGIGTALVEAAADRWGRLTADFDPHVRPFYEKLGFEIEPLRSDRYRGERPGQPA